MNKAMTAGLALALATGATANEVTVQNDSLTNFDDAAIVWGFAVGEKAGSWLTSPCTGDLVAVQVFWRSRDGVAPFSIQESIDIYRAGTFPEPGTLVLQVLGPVLNDNALNEYRYLDENNTLPISVPVLEDETVVVALTFATQQQPNVDPSVVRDTDGIQPGSNTIYGDIGVGLHWYSAADPQVGITGDWVIRAVVDCQAIGSNADVAATISSPSTGYTAGTILQYTIAVANAGPASAPSTTVTDFAFPTNSYTDVSWTCAATGGAVCPAPNGSDSINGTASLPAGGQVVYELTGTIASGTSGTISHAVNTVVNAPAVDPDTSDNSATLDLEPVGNDEIFADGFELAPIQDNHLVPVPARVWGGIPMAL